MRPLISFRRCKMEAVVAGLSAEVRFGVEIIQYSGVGDGVMDYTGATIEQSTRAAIASKRGGVGARRGAQNDWISSLAVMRWDQGISVCAPRAEQLVDQGA